MIILKYQPSLEQEVVALFCGSLNELGFTEIVKLGTIFPDCSAIRKSDGSKVDIEFEYCSNNFILHGHDKSKCDIIVCWRDDAIRSIGLEIIELSKNEIFKSLPENPTIKRTDNKVSENIMRLCYSNKEGLSIDDFKSHINKFHEDYRVSEARLLIARMISGKGTPNIVNNKLLLKNIPDFKENKWAVSKDKELMKEADKLLIKFGFFDK